MILVGRGIAIAITILVITVVNTVPIIIVRTSKSYVAHPFRDGIVLPTGSIG